MCNQAYCQPHCSVPCFWQFRLESYFDDWIFFPNSFFLAWSWKWAKWTTVWAKWTLTGKMFEKWQNFASARCGGPQLWWTKYLLTCPTSPTNYYLASLLSVTQNFALPFWCAQIIYSESKKTQLLVQMVLNTCPWKIWLPWSYCPSEGHISVQKMDLWSLNPQITNIWIDISKATGASQATANDSGAIWAHMHKLYYHR